MSRRKTYDGDDDDIETIEVGDYEIRADIYRNLRAQKSGDVLNYVCYTPVVIDDLWRAFPDVGERGVRRMTNELMEGNLIREADDGYTYKSLFLPTDKGEAIAETIESDKVASE